MRIAIDSLSLAGAFIAGLITGIATTLRLLGIVHDIERRRLRSDSPPDSAR